MKIKVVQEYPVPKSVKDVRAFVGLTNYYRKFVKGFAHIASATAKHLGAQSYSLGAPGYWAPVRQQPWDVLLLDSLLLNGLEYALCLSYSTRHL